MVSFFEVVGANGSSPAIFSPLEEELLENEATQKDIQDHACSPHIHFQPVTCMTCRDTNETETRLDQMEGDKCRGL